VNAAQPGASVPEPDLLAAVRDIVAGLEPGRGADQSDGAEDTEDTEDTADPAARLAQLEDAHRMLRALLDLPDA